MTNRRWRNAAVLAVALALIVGLVVSMQRKPSVPVARIGANVRGLTSSSSSCSITEGQTGGTCTISISPAAGSGASLTFAVTARTKGTATQAFSPVDANGKAPGGTGPDVSVTGSTGNSVTVSIPNGATSVAFPLTAINDSFAELDKTITATISSAVGVTIDSAAATTTVTILDNDRTGIFYAANYGVIANDGASDSAAMQATVAAANASGRGVVVLPSGQVDLNAGSAGSIRPAPGTSMFGAGDRATVMRRMANQCGGNPGVQYAENNACSVVDISVDQWNSASDSPWTVMSNFVLDGNNANQGFYRAFNQQHAFGMLFTAQFSTARAWNTGRLRVVVQHVTTRNGVAEGVSVIVNTEIKVWDYRAEGDFRGGLVLTGGNSILQAWSFETTHGGATGNTENTGLDIEVDGFGMHPTKGLTVDVVVDIRDAILDGHLDFSTYLPPSWMGQCFTPTGTTQCGTGSTLTVDGLVMSPSGNAYYESAGSIFLGVMRSQDSITITNSVLRWGGHNIYNENVVWLNQGTISIVDTRNIIGDYPYPSHDSSYTQPSLRVQGMGQSFSGGTFNLVRSSFEADAAPFAPASKCATERLTTVPTINWASVSLIGSGWCGSGAGYTGGSVNISTAPAGNTVTSTTTTEPATTTTAVPTGPTYDDTDSAFVFSALSTATTTTSASTTTTSAPTTTRKEVETCTLGAAVTTSTGSPAGASGSAIFGNAAVGSGTSVSCSITAGSAGTYTLAIRYQNAGAYSRPLSVNSVALNSPNGPTFPATSNGWSTLVLTVSLNSGSNTIVFDSSYQWFDWIEIASTEASTTTTTSATTTTTSAPSESSGWVAYGPPGVLDPRDYLQTNHTTSQASATATITFTGTSATLRGAKGPAGGKATVQRDSQPAVTIDTYSATEQRDVALWSESGLSNASHTVLVTVLGTNTAPSTNYYVVLDRLDYQIVASTTTTTSVGSSTTSTTIPSQGTAIWHDEFDAFDPTNATLDKPWAMNDPTWQNDERGYVDFAGPGTWNANRWEQLGTTGGGTTALDPFAVSGGVLTITNAPLPSNVAASVRASADAQGQGVVPTPTRYGGYLVTNRKYTNPTTGQPLEFLGGYFEWRVRFPDATGTLSRGMFPAVWLYAALGSTNPSDKGRAEIDVLESFGHASASPFNITTHQQTNAGVDAIAPVDVGTVPWSPSAWHKLGLDWKLASDPGGAAMRFYLDGVQVGQLTGAAAAWFTTPMAIRMNVASDAPWFGAGKMTDSGTSPAWRMQVDYVRVYASAPAGSFTTTTTTTAAPTTTTVSTTTTTPVTTTTAPGGTTTTVVGTRTVTVSAWQDTDRDGVKDAGEPSLGGSQVRLRNPSGVSTKLVTLKTTAMTITVPAQAGWSLLFTPPAGSTSTAASVAAIPSTGAFTVQFGGCCPRVTS